MRVPSNEKINTLLVKNAVTYVYALMCPIIDISRERPNVNKNMNEEQAEAWVHDQAKVISKPCASGKERHAKQAADLLHAGISKLNSIQIT